MNVFIFYIGAILGSFLALISYRLPRAEPISVSRSKCDKCNVQLKYYELIPIFSFLMQKGRCRYCKESITIKFLLIELLNGLIIIFVFNFLGISFKGLITISTIEIMLIISIVDMDYYIIPNKLNLILLITTIIKSIYDKNLLERFIYSLFFLVIFLVVYKLTRESIGMGDIKTLIAVSYFYGYKYFLLNIFISIVLAALYSIFKIFFKKIKLNNEIAFAPFIFIGFLITIFCGDKLIYLYSLFFY